MITIIAATLVATLASQEPRAEFEAVSVKRAPADAPFAFDSTPSGLRIVGRVDSLLRLAFPGRRPWQVVGIPAWAGTESFEVIATYKPGTVALTPAERGPLLQAMLRERFNLQTHAESRVFSVLDLTLAREDRRLGPDIQGPLAEDCAAVEAAAFAAAEAKGQPPPRPLPGEAPRRCSVSLQLPHLVGDVTMDALASFVEGLVRQPVRNATGMAGYYHVDLTAGFDRGPGAAPTNADVPSPFTALPEQLGLKLERARGAFPVVVIDHLERPSEN